jgi:capsular polysaccharide export protein
LGERRPEAARFVMTDALVMGVWRWKRGFVRPFLPDPPARIAYRRASRRALRQARRENRRAYIWASREPAWLASAAAETGVALTRIEDGFLRSAGLGSNCVPPLSLVIDEMGIYFDPSRPSGIEHLLNDPAFPSPELRDEAQSLRARLVAHGVTKYNLRGAPNSLPDRRGRRTILVPGQVENDASIRRGSPMIKRNLDLLAAVRQAAPDAFLLYKPHPEVEAGNRPGRIAASQARHYADHLLTSWEMSAALAVADEVHTMTSLAGFEALLRRIPVTTYGLPFYAGLGLTTDRLPWPRPRRPVDLDTLVAAVLLAYPQYRHPGSGRPASAFDILDLLRQRRAPARQPLTRALRWLKLTATSREAEA